MDELIVDMNQVSCYDMIEQYCADTVKQLNHLQKQRYAVCLMFNATKASEILACYLLCCTGCCDISQLTTMRVRHWLFGLAEGTV